MSIVLRHRYEDIISLENLLLAWREFLRGKRGKHDVQEFQFRLTENIIALHGDLREQKYKHGGYESFWIADPKPRHIHKASVRDRLLHHAICRILLPYFDRKFIFDSYSCRFGKGTHRAMNRFRAFAWKVSRNNTRTCRALKCDIRKFFASIDHKILLDILRKHISDENTPRLLGTVIGSFSTEGFSERGLPLGNLTSQLFANVYMNELDQYAKHCLKVRYYIRYADDFVILSDDREYLENLMPKISEFLERYLKLTLHPDKVFIKTIASSVDFLGWVHFPNYRVPRTSTKRRIVRRMAESEKKETLQSYLGLLSHGNTFGLREILLNMKGS